LEEVKEISDRITVIRDGQKIGTWPAEGLTTRKITELMTGLDIVHERKPPNNAEDRRTVLEIKNLSRAGQYRDINLNLK
ncbi:sugar ABC transporter ATP-binding protein, partial [Escherichia coli]|nr:sugar ABC transporter ATP-binding protein [Escherichia coli]